jgi:hypothetical protein
MEIRKKQREIDGKAKAYRMKERKPKVWKTYKEDRVDEKKRKKEGRS